MRIFYMCTIILFTNFTLFASEYYVSNAEEIDDVMNVAQPGDTLTMVAGVWTDQLITFQGNGVEGDSIVLRVEKPGHVYLNGRSRIRINGTYLKVDGLRFIGGSNGSGAIVFDNGSQHCRVTNTQVSEYNPPGGSLRYHWIKVNGSHHRLDHCYFSGQRHSGVTVHVSLATSPYGYHRIDHNHFADKPRGDANGYETLKVGTGDEAHLEGNIIAEYNYFYRCSGESEIISNKSLHNVYRYNTFVECQGGLTMRQGTHCLIEGNYFFGNDVSGTSGIRVTHRGHTIMNNYFQDLGRWAFYLHAGPDAKYAEDVIANGDHVRADSMRIMYNTVVNCGSGIYIVPGDSADPLNLPVRNNVIANNIITMDDAAPCYVDENHGGSYQFWEGNLFHGANLGDAPDSGYVVNDPLLMLLNDWFQISQQSPAINAAIGDYPEVVEDIDGIRRDAQKDIGADELGNGARQPLTEMDVGPGWIHDGDLPDPDELPLILTVVLRGKGNGEVLFDPPGGVYEAGTAVTLTAVPEAGHTFAGWEGDIESAEDSITVIMDKSINIRAYFDPPLRYSLAVWKIGSGSVEFDPPGGSYPESTVVKIEAIPDEGWMFSHWGNALSGTSNPDSVLMDSNKGITVTFTQTTHVETGNHAPLTFRLDQNYPNPFNPKTTIAFSLKKAGHTMLSVYDIMGHKVAEIVNGRLDAGHHQVEFDASGLTSGVYFFIIKTSNFESQRKMILMR